MPLIGAPSASPHLHSVSWSTLGGSASSTRNRYPPSTGLKPFVQSRAAEGKRELAELRLLWWKESTVAVHGPYLSGYYTFTAKTGMKFIILAFRFQNNWIRAQRTPYLNPGEIATNAGFIYSVWEPISGARTEEYSPRWSTDEEVQNLIGNSGAYEELLPGESVEGCVVFEIPEDVIPLEASLVYVPALIQFGAQP